MYTQAHIRGLVQVEKGEELAVHFTDLPSARLVLHTLGFRASIAGQLGGGVSVSLQSLVDFGWGSCKADFAMAIGKALWGSKWFEVMPGTRKCTSSYHQPTYIHARLCSGTCRGAYGTHLRAGEWHECMPELENLIRTGQVPGSWPAARDDCAYIL